MIWENLWVMQLAVQKKARFKNWKQDNEPSCKTNNFIIFKKRYIYIEPIEKSLITKDINKDFENIKWR